MGSFVSIYFEIKFKHANTEQNICLNLQLSSAGPN